MNHKKREIVVNEMISQARKQLRVYVRLMINRDVPEVMQIEQESFWHHWTEEDFRYYWQQPDCISMVAEQGDKVRGFMVYKFLGNDLHILRLAVSPACRRLRVGSQMVQKLINNPLNRCRLRVRETNLTAQLFFRVQRFMAVCILRGFYDNSGENAFLMQY